MTEDKGSLDFSNPEALVCLNEAIMKIKFNISNYKLPPSGFLIPRIPQRHEYLDKVEVVLKVFEDKTTDIRGFDIGTGANLIYPILGIASKRWSMTGSDINQEALDQCQLVIASNPLL